jgi:hypothetical protein
MIANSSGKQEHSADVSLNFNEEKRIKYYKTKLLELINIIQELGEDKESARLKKINVKDKSKVTKKILQEIEEKLHGCHFQNRNGIQTAMIITDLLLYNFISCRGTGGVKLNTAPIEKNYGNRVPGTDPSKLKDAPNAKKIGKSNK